MPRAVTLAMLAVATLLSTADPARGGGLMLEVPKPLRSEQCATGEPARFIGGGPPPVVVACVRLPGGERVQISDAGVEGSHCPMVAPEGGSDIGSICIAPSKSGLFGQRPARLLDLPAVHAGPRVVDGFRGFSRIRRYRRFVSGLAAADVEAVTVGYQRIGGHAPEWVQASLVDLEAEPAAMLGAPGPVVLYVAEIPPTRETCVGAEVHALGGGWPVFDAAELNGRAAAIGSQDAPCSFPDASPAFPSASAGLAQRRASAGHALVGVVVELLSRVL